MDAYSAAYGHPIGPVYLAVGWIQSRSQDIEITDAAGNAMGEKNFVSQQASLSVAYDLPYAPVGLTFKYLQNKFNPYDVSGIGMDLGVSGQWKFLRAGAKWQDIGATRLSGDSYGGGSAEELVPSRARIGFAVTNNRSRMNEDKRIARRAPLPLIGTLAVDFVAPLDSKWGNASTHYGGELWYEQRFAIRTGWNEDQGFSLGGSVAFSWLQLDYAFIINENFNPMNRVTTQIFFGGQQ
jgi:hypothetical protein